MKERINAATKAHFLQGAFYLLLLLAAFMVSLALGQQSATNSGVDPAKMSLAGRISSMSETAEAQPSNTPNPAATAVVVWDQYNNAGTAVTLSATFTDAPAMNSDLADDFVVPAGYAWMVRWIDVDGSYFNGPGPANTFSVFFYSDNGGFPLSQIYATFASWEQNGSTFRVHVCDNPPCQPILYPGRYWVEIQANMTAKCCGEWGWTDRTVTDLNAAVWRNPSGFFGACTSWSRRGATCGLDPSAPDQVYRIYAQVIPVCSVDSSNLGCGGTINFQPTEFSIDMPSCPVDPATVHTSSFTVNNIQPDSFTLLNNNTTIRFHYNTTPVVPGLNTMHVPAGGFNCVCGPVLEFTCTFTYQPSTPTPTPTSTPAATPTSTCSICFTPTPTSTPTASPTPTATATPPSCVGQYVITQIGGSIVPGTTDIGNHSNDLVTTIALPFSYTLYGTTFTSINLSSNGNTQFTTTAPAPVNVCLPWSGHNATIFPYWGDLRTDAQPGCSGFPGGTCGIYTSVSGSAPNRIFNIEWRTVYWDPISQTQRANFELRLYEGQTRFDVIYGEVFYGNLSATAGTQRDDNCFSQYFCNAVGGPASGGWTLVPVGTPSPTPTATATPTPTPTACTGRCSPTPRVRPTPPPRP